jgi:hypothetical protein
MSVGGIRTWRELNDLLRNTTEQQCKTMLAVERKGRCRPSVLLRIYSRYSVLRKERELKELFIKKAEVQ